MMSPLTDATTPAPHTVCWHALHACGEPYHLVLWESIGYPYNGMPVREVWKTDGQNTEGANSPNVSPRRWFLTCEDVRWGGTLPSLSGKCQIARGTLC